METLAQNGSTLLIISIAGSIVTTIGGIITLVITQQYAFRKAQWERELVKNEVVAASDKVELVKKEVVAAAVKVESKLAENVTLTGGKLIEIHDIVNSRTTALEDRIDKLEKQLSSTYKKLSTTMTQLAVAEKKPTKS